VRATADRATADRRARRRLASAGPPRDPQGFTDPGAMLARAHELDSGLTVRLRLARPTDARRVREFLERQSQDTISRRFFTAMPRITETTVRHFTHYDPRQVTIVAATALIDGAEEIVGLADVALLDTGLAEIGVIVDDRHQGEGLGRLLSEAIAWLAVQRGASHLKAEMIDRNVPMLRLMQRLGPTVEGAEHGVSSAWTRLPALRTAAAA
ncbi:MAG TPA: GNAT family protein, partial [Thermoleophilaceae bacterium]|nr:GNAT family protein [Thermoleophilaceae bacterium]